MWQIEDDLTGENYCGGGYCSEHLNVARYGEKGVGAPNCQSSLEAAVRGYGMDRWSFNIDACFNVFMTVAYDANGVWEIRPPKGKPGDYLTMRALMPQIVAISNCPVLFNACNNFSLKPLTLEILNPAACRVGKGGRDAAIGARHCPAVPARTPHRSPTSPSRLPPPQSDGNNP
jgi:uncharacterized protein YcgI (DUF1989 family)